MRWLQALGVLLLYVWLALGVLIVVVALSHGVVSAELRRGELEIMARIVQAETTGEPAEGARAVAWTMLNRLRQPETYGQTMTRVMLAPYQYAKPVPLNDNSEAFLRALLATVQAVLGVGGDPGLGATHFYRCDMRRPPRWAGTLRRTIRIGAHCFYKAGK